MVMKWRSFMMAMLVLLVCWGLLFWQGVVMAGEIEARSAKLEELKNEYNVLRDFQKECPDVEKYQMEVEKEKKEVSGLLPNDMEMAVFLQRIKILADRNKVLARELLPGEIKEEGGLSVVEIKAVLAGDYFSLIDFLRGLQNGERLVQISSMDITSKGEFLECRLRFKIFSEKK